MIDEGNRAKAELTEREEMIRQLEEYITSKSAEVENCRKTEKELFAEMAKIPESVDMSSDAEWVKLTAEKDALNAEIEQLKTEPTSEVEVATTKDEIRQIEGQISRSIPLR